MTYEIRKNQQFNSAEIYFGGKPSEEVRNALKALKFRWHGQKKCWYGYATEEEVKSAIDGLPVEKTTPAKTSIPQISRSHNINVGDLFYSSWGYEQTNVDFFQVVELVGKSSVRVRQVMPELIREEGISCMSSDRTYKLPENGELLPATSSSVFIEDNEHGDLKRVRSTYDGKDNYFKVGKAGGYQTSAYRYDGRVLYESWYA